MAKTSNSEIQANRRTLSLAMSAGASFSGALAFFFILGYFLDQRYGLSPILTIVGTVLGFILGNMALYKIFIVDERKKG